MSTEESNRNEKDKKGELEKGLEHAELTVFHYLRMFAFEEALFTYLKKEIERVSTEYRDRCERDRQCLEEIDDVIDRAKDSFNPIYATINEPVRLGAFRVLVNEVYKHVHGIPIKPYEDLALHGYLKEHQVTLRHRDACGASWTPSYYERVYVGIDYTILPEYPNPSSGKKVVVPMFIVAKSNVREDVIENIKRAVDVTMQYVECIEDEEIRWRLHVALSNLRRFTRIAVLRAVTSDELKECRLIKDEQVIYPNIACSVLWIVINDIRESYEVVVNSEALSELTLEDERAR